MGLANEHELASSERSHEWYAAPSRASRTLYAVEQPTQQTIYGLFSGRIQFQVPVYQRAYVWNEDENWGLLWDDIADTATRYLDDPEAHANHRHFLGPIVLSQRSSPPSGVDPRLVIDGQQRLTTLQVIIAATAAAAHDHGANGVAKDLVELTCNRGEEIQGDDRYKIWPSRRDRDDFLATIDNGADANASTGIPGAWRYFRDQIEEWITDDGEADAERQTERLRALKNCLEKLLYVVAINLDETDNAQVIFETLNARGTGLGALDLIKNAVFLQAQRQKAPADELHDREWEPTFEQGDYWLEETRQGREKRARADWFLMHWLAMELGQVVRADKLFDAFRKDVLYGEHQMTELIPRLCADARTMRSFDDFDVDTPEGLFFFRLETLDTTTMLPVALFLFRTPEITDEQRGVALAALESWLVRRMILRLTPKNYNRTLASLLKALREDASRAEMIIVAELRSSQADTALWPSDTTIRERLEGKDTYAYIRQDRARMLLEACELDIRDSAKTEVVGLPAGLSIEHALPQAWQKHWPVADEAAAADREAHVNHLGNLTLVTQPLNSSLSNLPWLSSDGFASKRKELAIRSVLLINQQLCEHDEWNEALIDQRGTDLTERILRTWPGPESDVWPARPAAAIPA